MTFTAVADFEALRRRCTGSVVTPSDEAWDAARQAWNLAVDQRPAAVAYPATRPTSPRPCSIAREAGLRVAVAGQAATTPARIGDARRTRCSSDLRDDEASRSTPRTRRARVRAGVLWQDVVDAARAARPRRARTAPRRTSASSATRSAAASAGSPASTACRPTHHRRRDRHGRRRRSSRADARQRARALLGAARRRRQLRRRHRARVRAASRSPPTPAGSRGTGPSPSASCSAGPSGRRARRTRSRRSARILQLPPLPEIPEPLRGRKLVMIDGA